MIDVFGNIRNPVHEVIFSIFDVIYIHIHMYTYIYIYIHTYIHTYIYIHTSIHHNPSAGDKFEVDGIAGDVGG